MYPMNLLIRPSKRIIIFCEYIYFMVNQYGLYVISNTQVHNQLKEYEMLYTEIQQCVFNGK